jgi:hypothetical protein
MHLILWVGSADDKFWQEYKTKFPLRQLVFRSKGAKTMVLRWRFQVAISAPILLLCRNGGAESSRYVAEVVEKVG